MSQLKLGDKVRFVNEPLEGIITSIKEKGVVGVTVDSDFEIPVLVSEVVKIKFEEQQGNNPSEAEAPKPIRAVTNAPVGIFLAFQRDTEEQLQLFFHNNLSEWVQVVIYQKEDGVYRMWKQFQAERGENIKLGMYQFSKMNEWHPLLIQMLPVESLTVNPASLVRTEIKFTAAKFHQWLKHCVFLNKQAYVTRLDEAIPEKLLADLKQKDFSAQPVEASKNLKDKPASLIDLHYDALKKNGYGQSADITSFQMEVFTQTLDAAFVHGMKEMVYIHGVGNAWLKNKIRTYLSKHPEMVASFEDADMLQFGGGATLVRLK